MLFKELKLKDSYLIEIERNEDHRGFFARTYCKNEFKEHNIDFDIVQTSISYNKNKGTIRGMHYQSEPYEEVKLIQCVKGSVYDIIIDLRKDSPTYKESFITTLSDIRNNLLLIPKGFIHGFQTLENDTIIMYYMNEFYNSDSSRTIKWDSSEFNIKWPIDKYIISDKDRIAPYLCQM